MIRNIAWSRFVLLIVAGLFAAGCSVGPPKVSKLPQTAPAQPDKSLTVSYSYDDAMDAAEETMIRLNLIVQVVDKEKGIVMANGQGGVRHRQGMPVAAAFYVKEISAEPKTRVDLVVKGGAALFSFEVDVARRDLISELQQVLLSYR